MAAFRYRAIPLLAALLWLLAACGATGEETIELALPEASEPDDHSTEFDPVDTEPAPTVSATPAVTEPPPVTPPLPTPTATPSERPPARPVSSCLGFEVPPVPHFVWDVAPDDPDGGLVAHSEPAVEAPVTRVLAWNALALRPTGGCTVLPSGTRWYELAAPDGGFDWVSSRFLVPTSPACLFGEAYGTTKKGDTEAAVGLFGPLDGRGVGNGEYTAFLPPGGTTWHWYRSNVYVDVPCFFDGPTGMLCISEARLFRFEDPEPAGQISAPTTAVRTGRLTLNPPERGLREEFIEVVFEGSRQPVWMDPAQSDFDDGPCAPAEGEQLRCLANDEPLPGDPWPVGSDMSRADHVRDLALIARDGCSRIVIEFGSGIDTGADRAATLVPPVDITKTRDQTVITLPACPDSSCPPFTHGPGDPHRVDFPGGVAFLAVDGDRRNQLRVEHRAGLAGVRIESNPARIIVDVAPGTENAEAASAPFGDVSILRPLQVDLDGPGLPPNTPQAVSGWSRPFEATLSWQILRVDAVQDLQELPAGVESIELVASGFTNTTGWVDGWGEFDVTLPGLEPGTYAVLFGEFPPGGDLGFIGSGQLIRILDPVNPDPGPFPTAELIPRIEVRVPVSQG